jgi:hypothetical protein
MMDSENFQQVISEQERNLRIQLLDYLFERGHRVSKPMIDAAAHFTYDYGQSLFEQGKMWSTQQDTPKTVSQKGRSKNA